MMILLALLPFCCMDDCDDDGCTDDSGGDGRSNDDDDDDDDEEDEEDKDGADKAPLLPMLFEPYTLLASCCNLVEVDGRPHVGFDPAAKLLPCAKEDGCCGGCVR
jgi:hypothetical protein